MPLFDRMKNQAQQAATDFSVKAQGAAHAGYAKIDALQAKRQIEGLLRDIGQLVYGQRTGRAQAGTDQEIDRIVRQIAAIEAAHAEPHDAD
jgi:hypothetical protein